MAGIDQDIIGITRTIYGTYLQTTKALGLPFTLIPNTTLNERFDVQAGVTPQAGQIPNMRYLALGNLGHMTVTAEDGSDETVPVPHSTTDAGLYGPIPWALREVTNDFPANIRARYGIRVLETHGGEQYWAYYLRRLDLSGVVPQMQHMEVINGVITTTPFVPTTDNLNPERPIIPNDGVVLGSDSSYSCSAILTINIGPDEVTEIINAHKIRTGSTRSPVISELALVSGIDREVSGGVGGGGSFTYNEVICAQVNTFISTYHAVGYSTNGMTLTVDVGGVEPALGSDDLPNGTFLNP